MIIRKRQMHALILAGGENRRMPAIKGLLEINRRRLIESGIECLQKIFGTVIVSTNTPEIYFYLGVPMIGDIVDSKGPMTGIFSVLSSPGISDVFATACDMPFINGALVEYIRDKWDNAHDACVPLYDNKPQPLLGIYSKKIAEKMSEHIRYGNKSLRDFLSQTDVLYVSEEEVRAIDPEGRSFVNINTMEDFMKETGGAKCLV
jgi:molybdenum cofactor guanylyltransferase